MKFSRQEYWNGLPFPPPEDLPNSGIQPASLACPALAGTFFTTEPPGKLLFASRSVLDLCAQSLQFYPTLYDPIDHSCQAPLPMGFFRQYWSGLPCPPPGNLPNPGTELASPALHVDSLPLSHWGSHSRSISRHKCQQAPKCEVQNVTHKELP